MGLGDYAKSAATVAAKEKNLPIKAGMGGLAVWGMIEAVKFLGAATTATAMAVAAPVVAGVALANRVHKDASATMENSVNHTYKDYFRGATHSLVSNSMKMSKFTAAGAILGGLILGAATGGTGFAHGMAWGASLGAAVGSARITFHKGVNYNITQNQPKMSSFKEMFESARNDLATGGYVENPEPLGRG